MAKWHIECVVKGERFSELMEILIPLKVEDLNFRIVAGTPTRIRKGDKPAWQCVVEAANAHPQPVKFFTEALGKQGFTKDSIYGAVYQAVDKGLLAKKKIKGANHYMKRAHA